MRSPLYFLFGIALLASTTAASDPPGKKALIEFGWDEPDTAFLRARIDQLERTPFDGCVFHVNAKRADGKVASLTWEGWGKRAFSESDVAAARDDLRAIRPTRFTRNFLRFNTTPADVDWFDDFAPIVANARLAAMLARDGRSYGILFDTEAYQGPLFDYHAQRDAKAKSFEAYADQARRRGREVMEAFQAGYPDVVILLTFAHSYPWSHMKRDGKALADVKDGLLAPFVDGMISAAKGKARIVDGFELSYGYKSRDRFEAAYKMMRSDVAPIVADRPAYDRVVSSGFGLWLDYNWPNLGWDSADPTKNYFTPEAFESSVRAALERSDEYVWIYTETPRWWSESGLPIKLPAAYDAALRRARRGLTVE
jgi:hypothetical protein